MCTRILWKNNTGIYCGRSMDWPESTEPVLTVFPRGMERNGGLLGGVPVVQENPAYWTSKYASMVTTLYGVGMADGFNEKGLGAHLLFLRATILARARWRNRLTMLAYGHRPRWITPRPSKRRSITSTAPRW